MSKLGNCAACQMERSGVKSRIRLPHTCGGEKRFNFQEMINNVFTGPAKTLVIEKGQTLGPSTGVRFICPGCGGECFMDVCGYCGFDALSGTTFSRNLKNRG